MPFGQIAHLGHVVLDTPDLEATVWFCTTVLGLTETRRVEGSAWLRAWDDYQQTTLVVRQARTSGITRLGLRASSAAALEGCVRAIEEAGHRGEWQEGIPGTGRTFVTVDPDGHEIGLYHDVTWYEAPDGRRPSLKNQPQAKPNQAVAVRRLDHVNFLAADAAANADFVIGLLGARPTEQIVKDDGTVQAKWTTFTNKSYDVVYSEDRAGGSGRLHHLAFATDTREEVLRAADLAMDLGVPIETGPHKHAVQQTFFLYLIEPGGHRIELCNPMTRLVLAPDWPVVTWTQTERAKGQAWGLRTIETFHTHGTPPIDASQDRTWRPTSLAPREDGPAR